MHARVAHAWGASDKLKALVAHARGAAERKEERVALR
jgi:hypothetical protein